MGAVSAIRAGAASVRARGHGCRDGDGPASACLSGREWSVRGACGPSGPDAQPSRPGTGQSPWASAVVVAG